MTKILIRPVTSGDPAGHGGAALFPEAVGGDLCLPPLCFVKN